MIQANNKKGGTLFAPKGYWLLTPEQKSNICNGVGVKKLQWMIPSTILGLDITEEANVHDYCWYIGAPFESSNDLFYWNVKRKIQVYGGWLMRARLGINEVYLTILNTVGYFFYPK